MIIVDEISQIPSLPAPLALTIGSFDGIHLGHLAILQRLKKYGTSAVLTFKNHPSQVLSQRPPSPLLCTPEHKLLLLEQARVDLVVLLAFTSAFSEQPFDLFLKTLRTAYPFTLLILGKGASFGKNKQGDEPHVRELGQELGFFVEYLEKTTVQGEVVSSGRIRAHIEKGELPLASALLGRPYSIYGPLIKNTLSLKHLCHPPEGSYPVKINHRSTTALLHSDTLHISSPLLPDQMAEIRFS